MRSHWNLYSPLFPYSACHWCFVPTLWQLCFPVSLLNLGIEEDREKILVKISRECAIVVKITKINNSKMYFFSTKKAWGEVHGHTICRGWLCSNVHFTSFPAWENCILESIKEPLAKKAKTAESCVETSDEDDNYDDDDLSSNDLSGVVATNRTTAMSYL